MFAKRRLPEKRRLDRGAIVLKVNHSRRNLISENACSADLYHGFRGGNL